VSIVAVGFGGAAVSTIEAMASLPTSDFAFFGSDMEAIRTHFGANAKLCDLVLAPKAPPPPSPPPSPPSPPGAPPSPPPPPLPPLCPPSSPPSPSSPFPSPPPTLPDGAPRFPPYPSLPLPLKPPPAFPPPLPPPLGCKLDFVHVILEDESDPTRFVFEPDGSLVSEFVLMERIYAKIEESASNDPYWCHLNTEATARTLLPDLPHDIRWECLDIASASTLGGLANTSAFEHSPNAPNGSWIFPPLGYGHNTSALLFGSEVQCESKHVGDGTVNSHDIAALMYAQFAAAPYYDIWRPTSIYNMQEFEPHTGGPDTTQGRAVTATQCGNHIKPNHYQLQLATDFCLAGHFPPAPPALSNGGGRRLTETPEASISNVTDRSPGLVTIDQFEQELVRLARGSTVMSSFNAAAMRWCAIPEAGGEWTRIRLPGVVLVTEIFLINIRTLEGVNDLDYMAPPPEECARAAIPDPTTCAPDEGSRDQLVVRFARRLHELPAGRTVDSCALVVSGAYQALKGNVLSLRQLPPEQTCPIDVYIWVPTRLKPSSDALCSGEVGVDVGSTAMDGVRGAIQLDVACAEERVFPPPLPLSPPSKPPPLASPPASPPPTVMMTLTQHLRATLNLTTSEMRDRLFELGGDPDGNPSQVAENLFAALCVSLVRAAYLRQHLESHGLSAHGSKSDMCTAFMEVTGLLDLLHPSDPPPAPSLPFVLMPSPPMPRPSEPFVPEAPALRQHAVVITIIASGTVDDFGSSILSTVASSIAVEAGVPPSEVSVDVASSSVLLTISVSASNASHGQMVAKKLATTLSTASHASRLLGISVLSAPVVRFDGSTTPVVAASLSPSAPPGVPLKLNSSSVIIMDPGTRAGVSIWVLLLASIGMVACASALVFHVRRFRRSRSLKRYSSSSSAAPVEPPGETEPFATRTGAVTESDTDLVEAARKHHSKVTCTRMGVHISSASWLNQAAQDTDERVDAAETQRGNSSHVASSRADCESFGPRMPASPGARRSEIDVARMQPVARRIRRDIGIKLSIDRPPKRGVMPVRRAQLAVADAPEAGQSSGPTRNIPNHKLQVTPISNAALARARAWRSDEKPGDHKSSDVAPVDDSCCDADVVENHLMGI